jgi:DNA-binding LacI/PurR family transcriptional regulator
MSITEPLFEHPASIRDVARVAGVSRQTVSRVINKHPSLRPETRDRVLAVIEELKYRPNRAARALGSHRSHTFGVLAAQRRGYGHSAAIQSIEEAAQELGYLVNTVNLVSDSPESIREALAIQIGQMVDGIVILAPQSKVLDEINELAPSIPCVLLHSVSGEDPRELFVDQLAGARAATRHLLDLGHLDICHLAGPQDWSEAEARLHGFLEELTAAGLPARAVLFGDWTADSGFQAGQELARIGGVTAVFCANDQMALGLTHAFHQAGLKVPGDISVVGFDDIPEAAYLWPPLTTVRQDFAELGRRCVARLVSSALLGAQVHLAPLEPSLVVRSSTGRPPRRSSRAQNKSLKALDGAP